MSPTPQQLFEMERTANDALNYNPFDVDGDIDSEICEKIARLFWERHIQSLQREKDARIYYQNIVYAVCSALDWIDDKTVTNGTGIVCGTLETPTTEVQDRMKKLVEEWRRRP